MNLNLADKEEQRLSELSKPGAREAGSEANPEAARSPAVPVLPKGNQYLNTRTPSGSSRTIRAVPALPKGSRYLITGGGTGGHVYPAIAIADEIKRRDPTARFLYVGVRGRAEARIVPRRGYHLTFVSAEGWPGRRPVALARFSIKLALGILKSILILLTFRPKLIIGVGGYVSAPVMLAAVSLRSVGLFSGKTFIHEQNTFPGKLNRLVGSMVDRVGVSFPESLKHFPKTGVCVGYPVRRELDSSERSAAREALGIPPDRKVVLAFGGSQGARTINRALVAALPALRARGDIFVVHGTGTHKGREYDAVGDTEACLRRAGLLEGSEAFYHRKDYFHNIEQVYAASDLVVCRAGAGTLTEIAARGIPALIIPKANLPGDHQVKNARTIATAGGGRVIYERVDLTKNGLEERVSGEQLAESIGHLLDDPTQLEAMGKAARAYYQPGALDKVAEVIAELLSPEGDDEVPMFSQNPPVADGPDFESMAAVSLIGYLENAFRHDDLELTSEDREYLEYRTDGYLASAHWQVRNRGVKLVGLLRYRDRLPHLLFLLHERRPAHWTHRLMGGDFEQVGFIRRNIFDALIRLDVANLDVFDAIGAGLEDNYYEVRSAAARAAAHFADRLGATRLELTERLRRRMHDSRFEVVCEVARALGKAAPDDRVLEDFRRYLLTKYWKIRQVIVESIELLVRRGVVEPDQAAEFLEHILITSTGFLPHFPLKTELKRLGGTLQASRQLEAGEERP